MGKPVGLHTMGIPAAISTLGVIVSFAIPQLWLGYGVLAGLDQPAEHVFVWVVLIALLFAGLNGVTMFMIGKGSMRAVRLHLTLAVISLVLTAAYLLVALSGSAAPGVSLTAALVSIGMLPLSGSCILSTAFYKMLLFTLHNRAWRKLSARRVLKQRAKGSSRKKPAIAGGFFMALCLRSQINLYAAGIINSDNSGAVIIPPIIGAAIRLMTLTLPPFPKEWAAGRQ
jgi:uncharacterized membrane protein